MSDLQTQPTAAPAGLSQWQRVTNTFAAPSKTFEDIKRGNWSWWMPFLITVLFSYVLFAAITAKVGWQQVAENNISMRPKQEARMDQLNPEQRANAKKLAGVITEIIVAASPVMILLAATIVALLMWGTINFVFGGKAKFGEIYAVNFYSTLPNIIPPILGAIALFAGLAPESFNINNVAGTNLAYYLSFQDTNKALYAVASQIDFVSIWVAVLLSIGIAKVAGKNKSAGYITVFGWWAVWTLIRVAGGLMAG